MISENPLLNGFEIKDKISTVVGFSQTFTQKRVSSFASNIPFTNKVFMCCNPGIKKHYYLFMVCMYRRFSCRCRVDLS